MRASPLVRITKSGSGNTWVSRKPAKVSASTSSWALNKYSSQTNFYAVAAPLLFFGLSIGTYILHGALGDTTNQIVKPRLGKHMLPAWITPLFMISLVAAEISGFGVLLVGFVRAAYFEQ